MTVGIAKSEWAARQAALFTALEHPKVVMVFGYGSALGAGTQSHGAMRYLTGWDSHEAMSLYAYTEEQSILLISSPFLEPLANAHFVDTKIIPAPPADWGGIITRIFGRNGPYSTVGFSELPHTVYQTIERKISPVHMVEGDAVLAVQRLRKSAQEIAVLERGAAICDELFSALPTCLNMARPAFRTQLELEHRARCAGADYCKTWLTIDSCADRPRYWPKEANQSPEPGDQVLFGIALTVDGYWAHGIRMGTIGAPTDDHRRLWSVVHQALLRGQEALRPNQPISDPVTAVANSLEGGLREFGWQNTRRFRTGHGLGTSYEEPLATLPFAQDWHSDFAPKGPTPHINISNGSVFELHPNLFVPSIGGAALGEMYVVEHARARPLLQFPQSLMELHISG